MDEHEITKAGVEQSKEILETGLVMDWRRQPGWNTLEDFFGIGRDSVGIAEALQQHAVLACVDVISRDVSKVDCDLYEKLPEGGLKKVEPLQHPLAMMLALDPNEEHNWAEMWQMLTINLVMQSNAYIAKRQTLGGDVAAFIPLMTARCMIHHNPATYDKYLQVNRGSVFEQAMLRGFGEYLRAEQFIHVRKRLVDGLHGLPTLWAGNQTIDLAKQIQDYNTRLYENDGQSRIVVQQNETLTPLSNEAFSRLKSEIRKAAKSMMSGGEAMLLEPGYTASVIAMTAADMKIAEMHDATINSVARLFGVPPHKIGHISDEKYSNMEVLERTYKQDVIVPIAKAFEDAFARACLTPQERLRYCFQFNRKQMEIVDYKQRAEVLKIGLQHGAILPDEFRAEFGYNPLPNKAGEVRFVQSTMTTIEGDSNEVLIPAGGQEPEPAAAPAKSLRLVK